MILKSAFLQYLLFLFSVESLNKNVSVRIEFVDDEK